MESKKPGQEIGESSEEEIKEQARIFSEQFEKSVGTFVDELNDFVGDFKSPGYDKRFGKAQEILYSTLGKEACVRVIAKKVDAKFGSQFFSERQP